MAIYRCFFRDADNKVVRLDRSDHTDDDAAIVWGADLLRQHPHDRGCEIWEGVRLVRELKPASS